MSQESGSLLCRLLLLARNTRVAQSPPKAAGRVPRRVRDCSLSQPGFSFAYGLLWCSAWWVEAQRTYSGEIASLVIFPRR